MADKEQEAVKPAKKSSSNAGNNIVNKINDLFTYIQVIYAERGPEPFKVPALIVLSITFCLYFFVYSKIEPEMMAVSSQVETLKLIANSLEEYNSIKASITEHKRKLPMYKDREEWLNYLIISTAKDLEIDIESLAPQKITESGVFIIASRDVETTLDYDTAGHWIEKLENAPVFLKITAMSMDKLEDDPTLIKLRMTISTLFIKD